VINYNDTNFITGLRFFAVFLVFLSHSAGTGVYIDYPMLMPLYHVGKYGVDIFFVISGFTIYSQLSNKSLTFPVFLYIRLARISSAYWPALILILVYYSVFSGPQLTGWYDYFGASLSFENIVAHFLYLGFLLPEYANTLIGVEWSLNIEIFYYFLLGGLYFRLSINSLYSLSFLVLLLFVISLVMTVFRDDFGLSDNYFLWSPFKYGYMFALGGIAFFFRKITQRTLSEVMCNKASNISILLCCIVFFLIMYSDLYLISSYVVSFLISLIGFMLLVFVKPTSLLSPIFTARWSVFLGSFSFSFYLLHYPISTALNMVDFNMPSLLQLLMNFLTSCIFAYIWSVLFEDVLYNKLKRKIRVKK
jgi:peptidoglycan/LPS O-acetylase OafA/YrhL